MIGDGPQNMNREVENGTLLPRSKCIWTILDLVRSVAASEVNKKTYGLYEKFRPEIPPWNERVGGFGEAGS